MRSSRTSRRRSASPTAEIVRVPLLHQGAGDAVAELVARALETAEAPRAVVLVRALGSLGNAWGWQTPDGAPRADEREALAKVLSEALEAASRHRSEVVRDAAAEAMAIVKG